MRCPRAPSRSELAKANWAACPTAAKWLSVVSARLAFRRNGPSTGSAPGTADASIDKPYRKVQPSLFISNHRLNQPPGSGLTCAAGSKCLLVGHKSEFNLLFMRADCSQPGLGRPYASQGPNLLNRVAWNLGDIAAAVAGRGLQPQTTASGCEEWRGAGCEQAPSLGRLRPAHRGIGIEAGGTTMVAALAPWSCWNRTPTGTPCYLLSSPANNWGAAPGKVRYPGQSCARLGFNACPRKWRLRVSGLNAGCGSREAARK